MGPLASLVAIVVSLPPQVRLSYTRANDALECVTEEVLRAAVARRLGYVPFEETSRDVLEVDVTSKSPGFSARLVRTTVDGKRHGARELYTPRADCADLGETLAFAISVAIDPLAFMRPPSDLGMGSAVSEPGEDAGIGLAAAVVPDAGSRRWAPDAGASHQAPQVPALMSGGMALGGYAGLAPGVSLSVQVEGRARWGAFSLGLQLRGDLLSRLAVLQGAISATPLQAVGLPCLHWRGFTACGLVAGGILVASASGLPLATTQVTPTGSLGARLSHEWVFGALRGVLFAEAAGALARTTLFVGDTEHWTSPPAWGGGGLGLFFGSP